MGRLSDTEMQWLDAFSSSAFAICSNKPEEALPQLRGALRLAKNRFGETHEHAVVTLCLLGAALAMTGQWPEALNCFKDARRYADMALEQWMPGVLLAAANTGLAGAFSKEKKFAEAVLYLEKARDIAEEDPSISPHLQGHLSLCLAEVNFIRTDYSSAAEWYAEAASFFAAKEKDKQALQRLAQIYARKGAAEFLLGQFEESKESLQAVLALQNEGLDICPAFIACINLLAAIYEEQGNAEKAEMYFEWGLESCQDFYGLTDPAIEALNFAACRCLNRKDLSKAFEHLKTSAAWVDKLYNLEVSLWIFHNAKEIAELQGAKREAASFAETLGEVYLEKYSGNYERDKAFTASGDQGEAFQRLQKLDADLATVQASYSSRIHPQVRLLMEKNDPAVWAAPVAAMGRLYGLNLLNSRAPIESVPEPEDEAGSEAEDALPQAADKPEDGMTDEESAAESGGESENTTGQETDEPEWACTVRRYVERQKHDQALAYLQKLREEISTAEGEDSLKLAPLLQACAFVYEARGDDAAAQPLRLRAQLLASLP